MSERAKAVWALLKRADDILGRSSTIFILAAFSVFVWLAVDYARTWLFVNWDDATDAPFEVRDQLEIASRKDWLKRSSASLLCGPEGAHIMLKSRLDYPEVFRTDKTISSTGLFEIFFDKDISSGGNVKFRNFSTTSTIIHYDRVDTVISAPLPESGERMLLDWVYRGAQDGMRFYIADVAYEGGLGLTAPPRRVSEFLAQCRRE